MKEVLRGGQPEMVDNFTKKRCFMLLSSYSGTVPVDNGYEGKAAEISTLDGKKEIHLRNLEVKVERILPECCF